MITAGPATRAKATHRQARSPRGVEVADAWAPRAATDHGGDRRRRRLQRRRTAREEIVVAAVLVAALIITVVVLALQWLDSTPSVTSSIPAPAVLIASGGLS